LHLIERSRRFRASRPSSFELERRAPFRPAHLKLVQRAHERGELVMAGSFRDPVDGALLLFRAEDPSTAERFANTHPYVSEGLVAAWRVRRWHEVLTGD
jgi:uncharacterized protein YciI